MLLPTEWRKLGLEEAYWFQEGPGVRKWQFMNFGIKLLNVANIEKTGQLNLSKTDRHLSIGEVESRYQHFLIDEGDLVIASSGISFDQDGLLRTRGAFVESKHLPLCLNTSTIRFKAKSGLSDLTFLKHWLDSREFREQITKLVTGSAQQNFGPSHLKAIQITLPPLPEQHRIAAILDQADALRAKRREALAQLDSLTQSIFIDMFGDPFSKVSAWPIKPLADVCAAINDCPHSTPFWAERGYVCLRTSNLTAGDWDWSDQRFVNEADYHDRSRRGYIRAGDIVLSREGTLGIAAIVQIGMEVCMGQRLVQVRCNEDFLIPEYLLHHLLYVLEPSRIFKLMVGSTAQHLNVKELRALPVPVPHVDKQRLFAERVQRIKGLNSTQKHALATTDRLFESLQHRAFRGEL